MKEGLFWLICHMGGKTIDWNEDWEIYHLFAKSDAISYKDAWRQFAQSTEKRFRRLPYDEYMVENFDIYFHDGSCKYQTF